MVDNLIHKIAVVAHHDDAAGEVLQVFLQYLQSHDIQVVRRLIEYEEIRVLHQYRTEIELATLSSTELIHIVILLFGCEEEILQQLGGRQFLATTKVNIVSNGSNHVYHFLTFIKL